MKKLVIWLVILLLVVAWGGALAEDGTSSSIDILNSTDDEEAFEQDVVPVDQGAPSDGSGPEVRWTYSVSMTALYSEYNRLVNRENLLSETYEPGDLEKMAVKRATSAAVYMRKEAGAALNNMFEAAKEVGYTLYLKSGYRSYGTQKTSYNNRIQSMGKDDGVVAPPGASEHQTGLACDILNGDYAGRPRMTTDFAETPEAQWMKENCAEYGFILRYPDGKTDITGIIFEPWHFRYVGKEIAGYVMRNEITFEEFTDEWQLAVAEYQGRNGSVDEQIAYEEEQVNAGPDPRIIWDQVDEYGDPETSLSFPRLLDQP